MKKKNISVSSSVIGIADFVIVLLLTLLSVPVFDVNFEYYSGLNPVSFSVIYTFLFIIVGLNFDLYSMRNRKNFDVLFSAAATMTIVSFFLIIVGAAFFNGPGARTLLATLAVIFIGMCVYRCALNLVIRHLRGVQKLLVIESVAVNNMFARKIKYSCLDWFDSWYVGINASDPKAVEEFLEGDFREYDNIFITQSIPIEAKNVILDRAISENKTIYIHPNMYDISITKYEMIQFADTPSFRIRRIGLNGSQRFIKRAIDIVLSLVGLIVLSPAFAAVAIAVKCADGGRVLYSQERITRGGKSFNIYKFRTMVENAEKLSGPVLATDNDPRITRVGRFLRATRLDEIPQLINILRGDMSIVGPRPERPKFVNEFRKTIPNYDKRHLVKAGLTGYAQVYSKYNTDITDKLLYDLLYIREYSLLLDLKIMVLTVKTVLTKDAAEGVKTESNDKVSK